MASVNSLSTRSKTRRRSGSFNSINVTPLLDVLIVLLIIFMLTAQMAHNEIDLNVPKVSSKSGNSGLNSDLMRVYINAKQEISVDERKIDNLEKHLLSMKKSSGNNSVVVIGDMSVPYQKLIEVLVSLNNSGFTKVKIAYDKK